MASSSKGALKLGLVKKIESPIAKYNNLGQLTCLVCNTIVKSEKVWTAHINGKQHKDHVTALKNVKTQEEQFRKPAMQALPAKRKGEFNEDPSPSKKGVPADFFDAKPAPPPKQIKSILKNSNKPLAAGTAIKPETKYTAPVEASHRPAPSTNIIQEEEVATAGGPIPEGFFDDPKLDAKVRQIEFKDPVEEEWERFQKEIQGQVMVSAAIQEEDQEESTVERQLEEIDEQMRKWGRVLELEQLRESLLQKLQTSCTAEPMDQEDSTTDEESDLDFDWRSKTT